MSALHHLLVAICAALACGSATAGSTSCDDQIVAAVLKHFAAESNGEVRDSACSPISNDGLALIAAVAHAPDGYSFELSEIPLPYYVAVVDLRDNHVVAAHKGGIVEDGAIQIDRGSLDWGKATYPLAPGVRGLALLIDGFRMSSAMDGGQGASVVLYAFDRTTVRPVMDELNMLEWVCPNIACRTEGATRIETKVTLSLGSGRTRGFRDLVLTANKSGSKQVVRYRAKYNGTKYILDGWHETWHK